MENKTWFLTGGVVLVIILLAAGLMANPSTPVQRGGQGGYGPGPGPGLEQGQGAGVGAGGGIPVLLPQSDTTPLTNTETAWILFMREEEQLAHDAYLRWAEKYPVPVFSTIAGSETIHVAEVQMLMDRYGLVDHRIGNASAGYSDPLIQSLYTTYAAQGDVSQTAALEAAFAIEERDIADLDLALANTTRADIIQVYSSLRRGSENHKSAFLRQLGR
ncbi:MAG: DUF2202 domain-containing protein [Methanoregulaceae archaeon]|nr:MAG: DUF2202 domain-containing protein [Methanoregulaceae archaeon]